MHLVANNNCLTVFIGRMNIMFRDRTFFILQNLELIFREHLKKSAVNQGLIGCFRGLVVNGEVLDIYSYMSVHLSEIIKDCKPSCVPNPCQNKAICKELWSSYECICKNPWAHLGTHCDESKSMKLLLSFLNKNKVISITFILQILMKKH